jgi:hypothetical protein
MMGFGLRGGGVSSLASAAAGGAIMAKSNRRKKQDREKAAVGRAERERGRAKAERERQAAEFFAQLKDPLASPAEVAGILAAAFPDRVIAAELMRVRMSLGVPPEEVVETARLLLAGAAPEPPGVGVLAVAALAAHLSGDEEAEHDYARELLASAIASGDPGRRMAAIGSATGRGHPGETCELIGPYLREHPDDELAAGFYAAALAAAYVQAEPGEPETAALERFGDRSGVDALDQAVGEFAERTQWGAIIRKWLAEDEQTDPGRERWRPAERDATDALLAEVAINFPFTSEAGDEDGDGDTLDTPLRAFAADPEAPTELAARAAERHEHIRYGVWQLADPSSSPGVWCTDLASGTQRYAQFPAEVIDGAPPARQWAEDWLGQAVAVLDFRTPRHAAGGDTASRMRLEGLLRQLEYQSALSPRVADAQSIQRGSAPSSTSNPTGSCSSEQRAASSPVHVGRSSLRADIWLGSIRPASHPASLCAAIVAA